LPPFTGPGPQEGGLGCADAAEHALRDREVAAQGDDALELLTAHLLLVVVTLVVAVVDLGDRRVAPVDDLDVGLAIDEAALADQDVPAPGAAVEGHVGEVGRADV